MDRELTGQARPLRGSAPPRAALRKASGRRARVLLVDHLGSAGIDFYREMEAIEDRIIAQALRLSAGNKKEAARLLHVNRTTLLEKLKRKRAQGSPLAALLGPAPGTASAIDLARPPTESLPGVPPLNAVA